MRRALYGTQQANWLSHKAVDRALKELEFVHLVVVPCTYFEAHAAVGLARCEIEKAFGGGSFERGNGGFAGLCEHRAR